MTELETLAARLDQALSALEAGAGYDGGSSVDEQELASLRAENARLTDELAAMKTARTKDLAELDELITQLKPLVGESA